jgi:hypothetical protein
VICLGCRRVGPGAGMTVVCDKCPPVSKDTAHCCTSKRDSLNRLPIGYCGPECERRPK